MTVKQILQKRISEIYNDNCPNVCKGYAYNGAIRDYAWWYQPFGKNPIWLGRSKREALRTLDRKRAGTITANCPWRKVMKHEHEHSWGWINGRWTCTECKAHTKSIVTIALDCSSTCRGNHVKLPRGGQWHGAAR